MNEVGADQPEESSTPQVDSPLSGLYPDSLDCVHCGLCLTACPTYRVTGRETSSPRGRVYLMRGVAEGHIELGGTVADEAYLCLGCRACETACPSGVRYGSLLERTRAEVERQGLRTGVAATLERLALRHVIARPPVLHTALSLLGIAQRLGLDRLASWFLPERLASVQALAPRVPSGRERRRLPVLTPAEGKRRGKVAFFEGCIMPEIFGGINRATVSVLARNGFDVLVPQGQGCCGALHAHSGDPDTAAGLARRNLAAFDLSEVDAVISNSAGCGAAMKETGHWLGESGQAFADHTRDILEFLDEVGLRTPSEPLALKVCYDDPCHLIHAQRVADAPRRVLERIPGLELIAHKDASACCGAAGIYNLTQPEMSQAVLTPKLEALKAADPDVIATGNPGCLMQIRSGAAREGMRAQVLHPVELLAKAYA